eukprot:3598775-Pyramimonas_sp.AAC.1
MGGEVSQRNAGLHKRDEETWEEFRDRTTPKSYELFSQAGHCILSEKVVRANFEFALEVALFHDRAFASAGVRGARAWRQTLQTMLRCAG